MDKYVRGTSWTDNLYVTCLSHPAEFEHPVQLSDRDRGSGRLEAQHESEWEKHLPYIMMDLNGNFGLGNCLHSIAFVLDLAATFRCGVYVHAPAHIARSQALLWEAVQLPLTDDRLPSIPFLRMLNEPGKWAALAETSQCILFVPGQVQYQQGWNFIESYAWRNLHHTHTRNSTSRSRGTKSTTCRSTTAGA